jgi:hypothetical protein
VSKEKFPYLDRVFLAKTRGRKIVPCYQEFLTKVVYRYFEVTLQLVHILIYRKIIGIAKKNNEVMKEMHG